MQKIFCCLLMLLCLQNVVLASAYEDYREMRARTEMHERYNTCIMLSKTQVTGYLMAAGVRSCGELGAETCQKLKRDYESNIKKCEAAFGKYK